MRPPIDEEYTRKILGIMAISKVGPVKTILMPKKVRVFVGKQHADIDLKIFAQLSPREILNLIGVPVHDHKSF